MSEPSGGHNTFAGGGEMGRFVQAKDWSATPLGAIDTWPASLRTAVSLVLNSNFPIALAWGPQHTQLYNDGYWPICAGKHPASMGQDFTQCWASAFPVIGEAFRSALAGQAAFLEDQRMFLDRLGYLEEAFFTFSFSPIHDEQGAVAGLFHPVTETTGKMLAQRRTAALRDLITSGLQARSLDDALRCCALALAGAALDLPFALFYRLDDEQRSTRLVAHNGLAPGGAASPERVDLGLDGAGSSKVAEPHLLDDGGWPLAQVSRSAAAASVDDVRVRFPGLVCAEYPEPVAAARVLPIKRLGQRQGARVIGLLVVGVSPRLPMNEAYAAFLDMLGSTVNSVVASALAAEAERERAESLAALDRAKTTFFANISHEFRTPLTLMLAPLEDELAECSAALPVARGERLATVHRNALRLLKLVNSLLDFSRLEAGRAQARYQPTDLAALTTELAGMFRSAIEHAGLRFVVQCPPLPQAVWVDRDMWEGVVLNLISNAFKHTFSGSIDVALRWRGEHVELEVADSGNGIPAGDLPHIFERFHQVRSAHARSHEGMGIGLSLVQELVRLHGGEVGVASAEGRGSTFTATLKTGREHLPAEHLSASVSTAEARSARTAAAYVEEARQWLPTSDAAAPVAMQPASGRARIVWADDNTDMRDYVRRLLAEHFDVTAVANGREAVAAALANQPDLVLSDIMMPGLDGYGVLRALRADERTLHIPVLLLSARAGEEAALDGLEQGADDYLVKPFTARELLARVRLHLRLATLRGQWAREQSLKLRLERDVAENRRLLATAAQSRQALLGLLEDQQRADVALQSSLADKTALLNEVHHRVKNNLQVVTSLLRLEAQRSTHTPTQAVLAAMQGRIRAMALLHESIYRAGTFASIDLGDYLRQVATQAFRSLQLSTARIELRLVLARVQVGLDQATPCGLLVSELISNALKHAFPDGRAGEVRIELQPATEGGPWRLVVSDNGVGLPGDFEARQQESLGLQLVASLAAQMGGRLAIGPGPLFAVSFDVQQAAAK